MRITERIVNQHLLDDIRSHLDDISRAQRDLSSGKAVHNMYEDSTRATRSLTLASLRSSMGQYIKNAQSAQDWMTATEGALNDVQTILKDAHQHALELGTDTASPEARASGAEVISELYDQLVSRANNQWQGASLFAGSKTTVAPFTAGGIYQGDHGDVKRTIGLDEPYTVNINGQDLFINGTNLFAALDTLKTALANNDAAAIRTSIDTLQTASNQVLKFQASLGANLENMQSTIYRLQDADDMLTKNQSQNDDADMNKATLDLQSAQNQYQASLYVSSQVFQESLLKFLM